MRIGMMVTVIAVVGLNFGVAGCAQNASEKRAASPTMTERFSHASVTGRVNEIGARPVSVRDDAGETRLVRVGDHMWIRWPIGAPSNETSKSELTYAGEREMSAD